MIFNLGCFSPSIVKFSYVTGANVSEIVMTSNLGLRLTMDRGTQFKEIVGSIEIDIGTFFFIPPVFDKLEMIASFAKWVL